MTAVEQSERPNIWSKFEVPFCAFVELHFWHFLTDLHFGVIEQSLIPPIEHMKISDYGATYKSEGNILWKGLPYQSIGYDYATGLVLTGPCAGFHVERKNMQEAYLGRILSANGGVFDGNLGYSRAVALQQINPNFDDGFVQKVLELGENPQSPVFQEIILTLLLNAGLDVDVDQFLTNTTSDVLIYTR